jgi:hypothetical protein
MVKIYISLASYRDPYLQGTIDSLFCEADNPENIKVGCFIHALENEIDSFVLERTYDGRVEYDLEIAGKLFSVTECRNRSLKWLDETYDYVLQIDSHSRFDQGWDTELIRILNSVEDDKKLLSGALPVFDILEDGSEVKAEQSFPVSFEMHTQSTMEWILRSYDLSPRGIILEREPGKDYARHWYLTGHFIFGPREYFIDVPQPDWVLFWGEEVLNGARTFTAGWNVYVPIDIPVYHLYSDRIVRPRLNNDFPNEYYPRREYTTDRIIDILSRKEIKDGDIFYERSLDEFYEFVGHDLGKLYEDWRNWRKDLIDRGRNE